MNLLLLAYCVVHMARCRKKIWSISKVGYIFQEQASTNFWNATEFSTSRSTKHAYRILQTLRTSGAARSAAEKYCRYGRHEISRRRSLLPTWIAMYVDVIQYLTTDNL
jgi:hypothetical protein